MLFCVLSGCSNSDNNDSDDTSKENESRITVKEEIVIIGKGTEYELGGTLTIPDGAKEPYAAVVLVQGSGPSDRDETINKNKPLKDIAEYLTSKGIAVLRYDKRTYTYQSKIAKDISNFTVKDEIINDTVLAANLLKEDSRIDKNKIFIIGHSLGGMIAPRIDAEGGDFAGIIIMAGSPRSFSDILYDQNMEIVNGLTGEDKITAQSQVNSMMEVFSSLKSISDEDAKKITLAGASGYYYKEMDAHPAKEYLDNITKPIFILQGDKDFQVYSDKDYKDYEAILEGKNNVTFKLYEGLNHFFMKSVTGTVDEYKIDSHVDNNVLEDISNWIISH